jgi:hypothetical protein
MCEGKYATVTTEAAIPVCEILGRNLEKTFQECATEKYFKNVLTAVPSRNVRRHSHADRFSCFPASKLAVYIERTIGSKSAATRRVCGLCPADPHTQFRPAAI